MSASGEHAKINEEMALHVTLRRMCTKDGSQNIKSVVSMSQNSRARDFRRKKT